jgi:hypothetical protein
MRTSLFLHQSKVKNGLALNGILFYLSIPDKRIVDLVDALKYLLSKLPFITARLLAQVTGRIISICHLLCIGECPSNSPFLKNNGAEAPKGPRSIDFKELRDSRIFSNLKLAWLHYL